MAALNWANFDKAVLAALKAGSGLGDAHVILAFQAAPRPTSSYIEANTRFSVIRQGMRDETHADATTAGQVNITVRRDVTVSCKLLGPNANALSESVVEYLQSETGREALAFYGITVSDPGSTKNLTEMLDTDWLEEAGLDFILSVAGTATEAVGWVQDVSIQSQLKKPDGGTIVDNATIGP